MLKSNLILKLGLILKSNLILKLGFILKSNLILKLGFILTSNLILKLAFILNKSDPKIKFHSKVYTYSKNFEFILNILEHPKPRISSLKQPGRLAACYLEITPITYVHAVNLSKLDCHAIFLLCPVCTKCYFGLRL